MNINLDIAKKITIDGVNVKELKYNDEVIWPKDFTGLTFEALQAGSTVAYNNYGTNNPDVKFSWNGKTWYNFIAGANITLANVGDKIYVKGNNPLGVTKSHSNYSSFRIGGKIGASGNVNSLIDDGDGSTIQEIPEFCFLYLFQYGTGLVTPPQLPATKLARYCYAAMFSGCAQLIQPPSLPATNLGDNCYEYMFNYCTSITSAPFLPATVLKQCCYQYMFSSCSNLKVNQGSITGGTLFFTRPSGSASNSVSHMFDGTGGTFKGTPSIGMSYYWYN